MPDQDALTGQWKSIAQAPDGRRIGWDGDPSHGWVPIDTPPTSSPARRLLTQTVGLPENVDTSLKGNAAGAQELLQHPGRELWRGTKQFFSGLDPTASARDTRDIAAQRYRTPGLANKAAGVAESLVGSVPYAGSPAVRSMEQAARGDYAGSAGSILNTAWSLLALKAAPQLANMAATTSIRPVLRRIYGIGEPSEHAALQDINEQASKVSGENADLARKQTGRQLLDEVAAHGADQIGDLADAARKDVRKQFNKRWTDLNTAIGPGTPVNFEPVQAAHAQANEFLNNPGLQRQLAAILKRAGFPDSLLGTDVLSKEFLDTAAGLVPKPAETTAPYGAAQRLYTQLGEEAEKLSGPDAGQLYRSLVTIQKPLGESLGAAHDAAGSGPAYRQLKADYTDFMENFNDPGAPIRQLIDADTPEGRMRVLNKYNLNDKVAGILDKYSGPQLASQIRSLVRTMDELPSAPTGQPKQVPEFPGSVEWRELMLRNKLRQQSQTSSPGEMAPGTFRTRTALARQLGVSLLDNPAFRNWLSGRSEQLRPYSPPGGRIQPPTNVGGGTPPTAGPSTPQTPTAPPPATPGTGTPSVPPEIAAARAKLVATANEGIQKALATIQDPKLRAEMAAKYGQPIEQPAAPTTGAGSVPPWAIGPLLKAVQEQTQRQAFSDLMKRLGDKGPI